METRENNFKVGEVAASASERRAQEATAPTFPNDKFPDEAELMVNIGDPRTTPANFFSQFGPRFTACWLFNHMKKEPAIVYSDAPSDGRTAAVAFEDDLRGRLREIFDTTFPQTRRSEDLERYIREARDWYEQRQA